MKIDRSKINLMPLISGPIYDQQNIPPAVYSRVESIMLSYETDPAAISPLLPEPFIPGAKPTVTVICNDNQGVDFMAGGGYRLAAVSISARFEGERDHLEGNYVLVMFENMALPIITGREWLGIHKLYADISPFRLLENGHLRCETSLWGHLLFGIDLPNLKGQNVLVRKAASTQSTNTPAFGYKYIASLDGPPDADYPTVMWNDVTIEQLWLGNMGELYYGNPSEQDIGRFAPVIDALKSLPVRSITQVVHWRGSMILRNDKNGRMR
jgi:acetoacetate decarboxylase